MRIRGARQHPRSARAVGSIRIVRNKNIGTRAKALIESVKPAEQRKRFRMTKILENDNYGEA